jgi:hypothetical protein
LGAFVDNINREFRFIGTSASGCGTATVGLSLAAARGLGARAGNFFGKWYFLPDFLAHSLELANSAASDFWDLAGSGHGVHDNSGLLDLLIDHDGPGECLFDGAHLDLLLELLVFNLSYNGLELRLLFICVLVLDGEWLLFNFRLRRTSAVLLSRTAASLGDHGSVAVAAGAEERQGATSVVHSVVLLEDPVFKLLVVG